MLDVKLRESSTNEELLGALIVDEVSVLVSSDECHIWLLCEPVEYSFEEDLLCGEAV